jgi:hypothetical protein
VVTLNYTERAHIVSTQVRVRNKNPVQKNRDELHNGQEDVYLVTLDWMVVLQTSHVDGALSIGDESVTNGLIRLQYLWMGEI